MDEARSKRNAIAAAIAAGQTDNNQLSADLGQEDPALQIAISASLRDMQWPSSSKISSPITRSDSLKREESTEQGDDDSPKTKRAKCSPPKEVNMETVMQNAEKRFAIELPVLRVPGGDTYIYIDPPPQMPEQDAMTYQWIRERYRTPLCMKKETLMKLNSPFLNKLFGSTSQYRVRRRRGLVNRLPPEIKYVLDLTPPNEGEEAMVLVSDLSCSEGIRNWVRGCKRWNISKALIGGHDDYAAQLQDPWSCGRDVIAFAEDGGVSTTGAVDGSEPKSHEAAAPLSASIPAKKTAAKEEDDYSIPLEYTAIRHRSAIERVLLAVAGQDPKLDSAPKVWTTAGVAKYFEIKHESVSDYIVRWLYAAPNTCFLEVMPETALRMADGLKISSLCRDAYAILVGEEALAAACQGHFIPGFDQNLSVHRRKKSEVPDKYQTYIEYASKAFRGRIAGEFEALVSGDWFEGLDEYTKLLRYNSKSAAYDSALGELKDLLQAFVRGAVYYLLCSNYENMSGPSDERCDAHDLFPTIKFRQTWLILHSQARILTRSFWEALSTLEAHRSFSNLTVTPSAYQYKPSESWDPEGQDLLSAKVFQLIRASDVNNKATECYHLYTGHSSGPGFHSNTSRVSDAGAISAGMVTDCSKTTHRISSNVSQQAATDFQKDTLSALDAIAGGSVVPAAHLLEPLQYQHEVPVSLPIRSAVSSSASYFREKYIDTDPSNQDSTPPPQKGANEGIATNLTPITLPFRDGKSSDRLSDTPEAATVAKAAAVGLPFRDSKRNVKSSKTPPAKTMEKAGAEASNRQAEADAQNWILRDHQDDWYDRSKASYEPKEDAISPKGDPSTQEYSEGDMKQAEIAQELETFPLGTISQGAQDDWFNTSAVYPTSPPVSNGLANSISSVADSILTDQPSFSQAYTPRPEVKSKYEFFNFKTFLQQAERHIHAVSQRMLGTPHSPSQDPLDLRLTNTLVCLTDAEWKYLPLWAGGNDDDSGGVFDDEVPLAETGFSTAGPKVHTGMGNSRASSEFEMLGGSGTNGSYHTSTVVNDGYSDDLDRRRVYDADSVWGDVMADKHAKSVGSSFAQDTPMDTDDGSAWEEVMTPTSADEFDEAERPSDKGKGKMMLDDDENLDDIFATDDADGSDFDDGEEVEMDDDSNYAHDAYAEMMEITEGGTIVYKGELEDEDFARP